MPAEDFRSPRWLRAAQLVRDGEYPLAHVARNNGLSRAALYRCLKALDIWERVRRLPLDDWRYSTGRPRALASTDKARLLDALRKEDRSLRSVWTRKRKDLRGNAKGPRPRLTFARVREIARIQGLTPSDSTLVRFLRTHKIYTQRRSRFQRRARSQRKAHQLTQMELSL